MTCISTVSMIPFVKLSKRNMSENAAKKPLKPIKHITLTLHGFKCSQAIKINCNNHAPHDTKLENRDAISTEPWLAIFMPRTC